MYIYLKLLQGSHIVQIYREKNQTRILYVIIYIIYM